MINKNAYKKHLPPSALFLMACCALVQGASAQAASWLTTYQADLVKVIDGDTIKVRLMIYPKLYKEVNLRIADIDTPESRRGVKSGVAITECEVAKGKAATAYAKAFLAKLMDEGGKLTVSHIDLAKSKYAGRINGQLWIDKTSYGQHMLDAGWAMAYSGGSRQPWLCDDNL
ncbi:MAG: thermonuclease family protein [Algicola sp.]|nr:thermonuclease family protein [Algicola sp.]